MWPFTNSSTKSIDVNEIDNLLGKVELIDIREKYEYAGGHLPTAKNIPMNAVLSDPSSFLDKSTEYYIICHSGSRSSMACKALEKEGFSVVNVSGGTGRYRGKLKR